MNDLTASVAGTFDILRTIVEHIIPYIIAIGIVIFVLGALELFFSGNEEGEQESGHRLTHRALLLVGAGALIYVVVRVVHYIANTFEQLL